MRKVEKDVTYTLKVRALKAKLRQLGLPIQLSTIQIPTNPNSNIEFGQIGNQQIQNPIDF